MTEQKLRALRAGASFFALSLFTLPGLASAQDTASDAQAPAGAGDIIVTANKREQNLSNVGAPVAALSGAELALKRINSVEDLAKFVPGLKFTPSPNATPVYTLRGIGFFESSLASYPDVATYIDQMPLPFPAMTTLTAFDLDRVEVLKGPQGTLFGNNATGGAINFVAAKPTNTLSAGVSLGYARFNTIEATGFVSGPITDSLRARLAFRAVRGDGWQKSNTRTNQPVPSELLALGVPDNPSGRQDYNGRVNTTAARLLVDWDASDALSFNLNVNGWIDKSETQAPQYHVFRPQYDFDFPLAHLPLSPRTPRAADWNPGLPRANNTLWQVALRTDLKLSDDLTLTALSSYVQYKKDNGTEGDGTALDNNDLPVNKGKIKSFSQEVRLANDQTNPIRWVAGVNYEHSSVDEFIQVTYRDNTSRFLNGFSSNYYGSEQKMDNYAAFANVEADVTQSLRLKGGVRYTEAKRDMRTFNASPPGYYDPYLFGSDFVLSDAYVSIAGQPGIFGAGVTNFFNFVGPQLFPDTWTPVAVGENFVFNNGRSQPGGYSDSLKEHNVSFSAGVDYRVSPDLLTYLNVSKGYKAGSFPTTSAATTAQFVAVKQESLVNYEVGFKARFADGLVSVNGSVFYYDYKNKQLRAKVVDPLFNALDALVNVPKSRVKGAELEMTARPLDGLNVNISATYLDAKIKRYEGVVGTTTQVVNGVSVFVPIKTSFSGVRLPYSPKWQLTGGFDYTVPIGGDFQAFIGARASYNSEDIGVLIPPSAPAGVANVPTREVYYIRARTLVDANFGIITPGEHARITFWVTNLTNQYHWTNTIQDSDTIVRYPGRPREFGLTVAYKF